MVFNSNSFKGSESETILTTTPTPTPGWQNITITTATTASTIQTTKQSTTTVTIPTVTTVFFPSTTSVPDNTSYSEEPPVKLLEVESLAERFPASESQYRVSMENGYVRLY